MAGRCQSVTFIADKGLNLYESKGPQSEEASPPRPLLSGGRAAGVRLRAGGPERAALASRSSGRARLSEASLFVPNSLFPPPRLPASPGP